MTSKAEILQAFYRSGRPVDVIDSDGWHMLMWNRGDGIACVGMWQEGQPITEKEWTDLLCGSRIETFTSTARFVLDVLREGCRIESINSGRYNRH